MREMSSSLRKNGFTLVEMIIVIVIAGIVAGMVAVFMRGAFDAYFDSIRRAELSDVADTALRRVARELQGALPNSIRSADKNFIEFLPIKGGGRYRADVGQNAGDDPLDFSAADSSFDVFGPAVAVAAGDSIVVYNLGIPGSDAYETATLSSRRLVDPAHVGNLTKIYLTVTTNPYPLTSPGSRFQVIDGPVSYVCDLASRTLWRYSGYAIQAAQPTTLAALNALANVRRAALATGVTTCGFSYTTGMQQRNGQVILTLDITHPESGETVNLLYQVNGDNTP